MSHVSRKYHLKLTENRNHIRSCIDSMSEDQGRYVIALILQDIRGSWGVCVYSRLRIAIEIAIHINRMDILSVLLDLFLESEGYQDKVIIGNITEVIHDKINETYKFMGKNTNDRDVLVSFNTDFTRTCLFVYYENLTDVDPEESEFDGRMAMLTPYSQYLEEELPDITKEMKNMLSIVCICD